jgi:hypothetical protein
MAAVKVKPIQPTIITDIGIIRDIIKEATTPPSSVAIKQNKEASALLSRLQKDKKK